MPPSPTGLAVLLMLIILTPAFGQVCGMQNQGTRVLTFAALFTTTRIFPLIGRPIRLPADIGK